jgi:hypothetical protein
MKQLFSAALCAVDATQPTSADNLVYLGSVDREALNVQ